MLFVLLLNSFVIYKEVRFSLKDFLYPNMFFSLDTLPRYNVCVCVVGLAASAVDYGIIPGLVKGLSVSASIVIPAASWVK